MTSFHRHHTEKAPLRQATQMNIPAFLGSVGAAGWDHEKHPLKGGGFSAGAGFLSGEAPEAGFF